MSTHAQTAPMRFLGDDGDQLGLYRTINLDLRVAEFGVAIDALLRFIRRRSQNLDRSFVGSGTVDEARGHNARANLPSSIDFVAQLRKAVDRVAQIAHRCNAGRDI